MNERYSALAHPARLRMLAATRCDTSLSPNYFGQTCFILLLTSKLICTFMWQQYTRSSIICTFPRGDVQWRLYAGGRGTNRDLAPTQPVPVAPNKTKPSMEMKVKPVVLEQWPHLPPPEWRCPRTTIGGVIALCSKSSSENHQAIIICSLSVCLSVYRI